MPDKRMLLSYVGTVAGLRLYLAVLEQCWLLMREGDDATNLSD